MDRQQKKVYAWESQWCDWNTSTMNLREARAVVGYACRKYGVAPPSVTHHGGTAYSYSQDSRISFRKDQKNAAIALHEAAHYVCDRIFEDPAETKSRLEDHGPEWMGVYLWLLEGYRVAPRIALHSSAAAKGIRWVPLWTISPKRLRRGRVASP